MVSLRFGGSDLLLDLVVLILVRNADLGRGQSYTFTLPFNIALLIIGLDDSPSPQIIETLKQEQDILSVRLVDLTQVQ